MIHKQLLKRMTLYYNNYKRETSHNNSFFILNNSTVHIYPKKKGKREREKAEA